MRYAEMLHLPLAYSTNGKGIVEHDYDTGRESNRDVFPSPEEMWRRYQAWKGIIEEVANEATLLPFNRDLRLPDRSRQRAEVLPTGCHRRRAGDDTEP